MQLVGTQQALAPALVAAQYTKVAVSVTAGAGASGRDDSGAEASGAVELAALAARGGAGALGDDSAEVQALVGLARETVWSEGFSAALAGREAMLRSLLRMGVRFTSFQELALKAAQEAGLSRALEAVEAALADGRTFLVGERVSLADVVLACGLLPAFACLLSDLQRASFPRATRWFSACTSQPEFAAVLGEVRLPCEAREGGQIDARPDPRVAARAADFSIALNRSAPKEHVHRKADKPEAAKAEDAAAGGAAGAGAAAAAGSAPAVKSTCAVSAVSARAPHALFQSRVGTPASAEEDAAIVAAVEARLAALGLAFRTYAHEEVLTVEQQAVHTQALGVEGVLTKNLFLKVRVGARCPQAAPPRDPPLTSQPPPSPRTRSPRPLPRPSRALPPPSRAPASLPAVAGQEGPR